MTPASNPVSNSLGVNKMQQKDIGGTKVPSVDQGKSPASTATKAAELAAKNGVPLSPGHDVDAISKPAAAVEDKLKGGPKQVEDLLGSGSKEPASVIDGVPKGDGLKKALKKPSDVFGFPKTVIDKVKKGPETAAHILGFGSKEPGDVFKGSPLKGGSGSESNGPLNIFRSGIKSLSDGLGSGSKGPANMFGGVSKGVEDQEKEETDEVGGVIKHKSKDSSNVFGGGVKQAAGLFSGSSGGLDTFWR